MPTSSQTGPAAQVGSYAAAQLNNVSQLYGRLAALRHLTYEFPKGQCHVLLGDNGAGKSTLLRVLAGLIRPTLGSVAVLGGSPQQQRGRIGYMSHAPMLYDELTALENLRYYAGLYADTKQQEGCIGCACSVQPESALRAVGLDPQLDRTIGQYSQGMRQRASLARVLLSQPELLLLDEPFSNMDAVSAQQMIALLREMSSPANGGSRRTVILTTHQPELARPIADVFITMRSGQIISSESLRGGEVPTAVPPIGADPTADPAEDLTANPTEFPTAFPG